MYHSGRHPLPPSQQHQYSPHQYQTRPPQQQGTCCQSRNPCSCPPPQEQPRYCICGRHGRRLMQRHEPHCPCEVRGQRHEHTPIWTADPDDCETNRIKRHIIQYKICKERELQNASQTVSQYSCKPILKDRWLTEHRDQYRYYVNRCALHDNCAANCETGCGMVDPCKRPPHPGDCFQEFSTTYSTPMKSSTYGHPAANSENPHGSGYLRHGPPPTDSIESDQTSPADGGRAKGPSLNSKKRSGNNKSRALAGADASPSARKREISEQFQADAAIAEKHKTSRRQRPPFHNYGSQNQRPVHPDDYMKTYNINPERRDQVYPYLESRRDRTSNYSEWKKFIKYPDPEVGKAKTKKSPNAGLGSKTRSSKQRQHRHHHHHHQQHEAEGENHGPGVDTGVTTRAENMVDGLYGMEAGPQKGNWTDPARSSLHHGPDQHQHHNQHQEQNMVQYGPSHSHPYQKHHYQYPHSQQSQGWALQPEGHSPHPHRPTHPTTQTANPQQMTECQPATGFWHVPDSAEDEDGDSGCVHKVSEFVNFEPCPRPETHPRNYKGLPPHFTQFIVPAGKKVPVSIPAGECFRMFD